LALGASNLMLRRVHLRRAEWLSAEDEPRRQPDSRLGWTWVPGRTGHKRISGRVINYAIDPAGYRVSRVDEPVDLERPTILFTGESAMFAEGLTWEETIPAQVGTMMGMQSRSHSSRMVATSGSSGNSSWEHSDFSFVTWLRANPSQTSMTKSAKLIEVQRKSITALMRSPVHPARSTIQR
jgi:hypothetical protein